jgi:hypothetical protein
MKARSSSDGGCGITSVGGRIHEHHDSVVVDGKQKNVFKPLIKLRTRSRQKEEVGGCC